MSVEEIKVEELSVRRAVDKKKELERTIEDLLVEFANETSLEVGYISANRIHSIHNGFRRPLYRVEVDVNL